MKSSNFSILLDMSFLLSGLEESDSSLITHHSSLITHHSSLITHHSSLITHHSSLITHHSSLITQYEAVIRPLNILRQQLRIALVLHFMRDVGEVRSLRLQFLNVLKRLFQPQMGLVRTNAQTVEHQYFQIAQPLDC